MLSLTLRSRARLSRLTTQLIFRGIATTPFRTCPDLRILFCGSDDFSAVSLSALVDAGKHGKLPIKSLEVLCRPPKRTGRGLKNIREVPIVKSAQQLGLPVHKIDTFKGWDIPASSNINLVIAVSFGLLIPARIINDAKYGGLNVHPSLLPDFPGAAPIEHALLEECSETGVSLQTLHPTKFDHGALLRQETAGIGHIESDVLAIKSVLAEKGARILVDGLRSADFVAPLQTVDPPRAYPDGSMVQRRKAPKIHPEDMHVKWAQWSPDQILTRQKVLGPLWSNFSNAANDSTAEIRIKWSGGFRKVTHDFDDFTPRWLLDGPTGSLLFPFADGIGVQIDRFTVAGKPEKTVRDARQYLKVNDEKTVKFD